MWHRAQKKEDKANYVYNTDQKLPELFQSSPHSASLSTPPTPPLSTHQQASILLSSAPLLHATHTHLQTLHALHTAHAFPDTKLSANLIASRPEVEQLARRNEQLVQEVAGLRERTARLLERLVAVAWVGMGEVWGEWEERVRECERGVRRAEAARRRRGEDEGEGEREGEGEKQGILKK